MALVVLANVLLIDPAVANGELQWSKLPPALADAKTAADALAMPAAPDESLSAEAALKQANTVMQGFVPLLKAHEGEGFCCHGSNSNIDMKQWDGDIWSMQDQIQSMAISHQDFVDLAYNAAAWYGLAARKGSPDGAIHFIDLRKIYLWNVFSAIKDFITADPAFHASTDGRPDDFWYLMKQISDAKLLIAVADSNDPRVLTRIAEIYNINHDYLGRLHPWPARATYCMRLPDVASPADCTRQYAYWKDRAFTIGLAAGDVRALEWKFSELWKIGKDKPDSPERRDALAYRDSAARKGCVFCAVWLADYYSGPNPSIVPPRRLLMTPSSEFAPVADMAKVKDYLLMAAEAKVADDYVTVAHDHYNKLFGPTPTDLRLAEAERLKKEAEARKAAAEAARQAQQDKIDAARSAAQARIDEARRRARLAAWHRLALPQQQKICRSDCGGVKLSCGVGNLGPGYNQTVEAMNGNLFGSLFWGGMKKDCGAAERECISDCLSNGKN